MQTLFTTGASLVIGTLVAAAATSAAVNDDRAAASALGGARHQQIAAAGNRLTGPQIRHLLSGHTARMERKRRNKSIRIALSFRAGGTVRHTCTSMHVNVRTQAHMGSQCRTADAGGNWEIRGNKLCVTVGKRRCYLVIRRGGGYIFRSPSGKGRPYAGRVSVQ